eukprot:g2314.t1
MDEPKKGALLVPGLGVEGASGKLPTPELAGQGKALPVETKPKNTFAEEVEHIKSYQRPEEPSFVLVGSMENKKDKRAVAAPADGATQQRTGKGNTAQHVLSVASVAPQGVRLDQTIGNTCSHNGNLVVNPANGNIAYPAGRIVVLASANLSHELFHFYCRKAVSSICWSSDGRLIAIGERGHHPGISVWREEKAGSDKLLYKQIAYLHKHKFGIKRVAFNTEGTVLASIGFKHDHAASFWKIGPHGGMPQSLPVASGDTSTDNSWGTSTNGNCGGDKTIVLSAVDKGESSSSWKITKEKVINSPHGTFYDMNLHENNRWLITAGKDRKVQVWSLNSGKKLRSWKPTDSVSQDIEVYKIVLDPTGTYAATCSFDKFIRIYDFLSGACIARFTGHSEIVSGICFTADCKRLVTVGGDGCVLVWRLPSPIGRAIRERKKECIAKRQRAQLKLGPQKPVDNMKPQTSTEKIGAELENVDTPTKVLRKDEQHAENDFKLPEPMDELTISATLDSDIGDGLPAWAKTERDVATKETVELSKDADPTVNGPTSSPARVPTKGDSPPRFIAPKTLAEERRSLALRQQGKEANAAVANMRSKLAELGILPKTEAEPSNIDPQPDSESANNQDNEPSSEAPSADIFEKHADVANQTIELNSSQTSMTPLTIELPDETEQCVPIPDPEENKKRAENSRNVAETSESLEVVTSEAKVPKYESAKASGKVAFDGRVLPPPQSSASPKRSAVSQKPPVDVQSSQQLTHPAEEYRQSLVDLRAAFSRAVNMFKEVDDVRQSLPSISDREGVEKLFAEFQNEFRELKLNSHDIAREQQTALVESEDDADSDDEETISTLLELAARLKRKKRKNRRSLSSSLTRNSE